MAGKAKNLWHSEWVEKTANDGLWTALKGKPRDSKFKDKPKFVGLEIGEEGEFTYNIENATIEAQLTQLETGKWYFITALGGREDATLEIRNEDGEEVAPADQVRTSGADRPAPGVPPGGPPSRAPASESSPKSGPPARQNNGSPPSRPSESYTIGRVYWEALKAAGALQDQFEKKFGREMNENDRQMATTILIQYYHADGRLKIATLDIEDEE